MGTGQLLGLETDFKVQMHSSHDQLVATQLFSQWKRWKHFCLAIFSLKKSNQLSRVSSCATKKSQLCPAELQLCPPVVATQPVNASHSEVEPQNLPHPGLSRTASIATSFWVAVSVAPAGLSGAPSSTRWP